MSDQDKPQEWTAEWLANFGNADNWLESVCEAHNAALSAEREKVQTLVDALKKYQARYHGAEHANANSFRSFSIASKKLWDEVNELLAKVGK